MSSHYINKDKEHLRNVNILQKNKTVYTANRILDLEKYEIWVNNVLFSTRTIGECFFIFI